MLQARNLFRLLFQQQGQDIYYRRWINLTQH